MAPAEDPPAVSPALRTIADLVLRPADAFRAVRTDPLLTAVLRYGAVFLATLVASGILAVIQYNSIVAKYTPRFSVQPFDTLYLPALLQYVLVFTAGPLLLCLVVHAILRAACGPKDSRLTLVVVLYAAWPVFLAFGAYELLAASGISGLWLVIPVFIAWAAILLVIGLREVHGLQAREAALPVIAIVLALLAGLLLLASLPPPHG